MRIKIFSILFALLLTATCFIGFAQPGNGRGAPHPCPPNNPNCPPARVPITETIIILLVGGLGLGLKTVSKKKKND
jgi:hypothetical protein